MARKKKEEVEVKDLDIKVDDEFIRIPILRNDPDPGNVCTAVINFGVYSLNLRIDSGSAYGLITMQDGSQYEFTGEIQSV